MRHNFILILLGSILICTSVQAQVLKSVASDPNTPDYPGSRPQPSPELSTTVARMQALLLELKQGDLDPVQQQAALEELILANELILRQHGTWLDWQQPQTVDSVALLLERMVFEQAAELAPGAKGREQVLKNAPADLGLEADDAQVAQHYSPPLLAPVVVTAKKVGGNQQHIDPAGSDNLNEMPGSGSLPENADSTSIAKDAEAPALSGAVDGKARVPGLEIKAAVLADDKATTEMHEDNVVLRDVTNSDGELVLFGKLRLWLGGSVQLDSYRSKDLYTVGKSGGTESDTYIRRARGILRASVLENGEVKVEYDFESNTFTNVYWRWLTKSSSRSLTVGNQKEPMGLDFQVGSKFATAMETSAPTSAFGSHRSAGARYNAWSTLESTENPTQWWGDNSTYITTSVGLFGRDLEDTNDTDWAVTGRVTVGGLTSASGGFHVGVSSTYRHGDYNRIAPRAGLYDANRISLAHPEADTLAVLGLEGMFVNGSLHGQTEFYYSDYDGDVGATGWGGYGQLGWLFGGKNREYQPRWGTWAPLQAGDEQLFEAFARISYTAGDDDINSSNEMGVLTVGGNWYYRQFRVSTNILLVGTQRDIDGESEGHAVAMRLQYLF